MAKQNSISGSAELGWMQNDLMIRRAGYSIVLFMVIVVGGWMAFAPIESAALAPGIIQVQGKRKPIQHLAGGIVSEIRVSSVDVVEKGQLLATWDATRDRAEREILRGRILNTLATIDRLKAERDDLPEINFSPEVSDVFSEDSRARAAMDSERSLFSVRLADRLGEEAVITSQIAGFQALKQSKTTIFDSVSAEIDDLKVLLADGYVDKMRIRELERSKAQILGEINELSVSIEKSLLNITQLKKKFKTQVVDDLTEHVEGLFDVKQQYAAVDDRVTRASIEAPVAGVLLDLQLNTIGGVVRPGETLMEIVPQRESLVVEARISPMDIDRVRLGQTAEVRLSVFKDAYTISGELTKLAPDRVVDEQSGIPYYAGEVNLFEADLPLLQGASLVPGMPAEVIIKTGERTMFGYIFSPLNRLFSRALIED